MHTTEALLACCAEHLRKFVPDAVRYVAGDGIYVNLEDEFTITVDDADVEDDEMGDGSTLPAGRSFVKLIDKDTEHGDLLDACLDAIAQDPELQPLVEDLTTDGDGKDCEAIFDLAGYGYVTLKVR